ncbi:hypothetical protein WJX74_001792 [Apatococcus lobatus]|uniref:Cilia- and flagella-associated protein 43 n=1 Tax=Apatococcus lobatus TaxID=904363 RepID=A0AAW1QXF9_9CHLO
MPKTDLKVTLTPSFVCGNSSYASTGKLAFLGESTLLRSVGRRLATFNTATNEVNFIPERPGTSVTAFAVARGSKLIAVAESDEKTITVTSVTLQTGQRQEAVELPGRVNDLSFSGDGAIIAALCPDNNQIVTWMAGSRTFIQTCQADAHSCDFGGGPRHETLAIAGLTICCLWTPGKRGDLIKADVNIQAPEGSEILAQAWLKGGVLALAFSSGDVLLRQDEAISSMTIAAGASLHSIAAFERGFVVGGTNASIAFMEPSTAAAKKAGAASYQLMRSLRLPASNRGIIRIAVSQSDAPGSLDNLAAETGDGELLLLDRDSFNLTSASDQAERLVDDDAGPRRKTQDDENERQLNLLQPTGAGFHRGRLNGFDIGGPELLLASVSTDRTLRMYEVQAKALRFAKQLIDMPKCISIHPMGFMVLIGFAVELNLYYVLRDDLELIISLPLKHCGRVKFSHLGHLFAAVDAVFSVHLYSTHDRSHLAELKGHQGPVACLSWSQDDAQLASLGAAAAYRWDVPYRTRVHADSMVHKGTIYCSGKDSVFMKVLMTIPMMNIEISIMTLGVAKGSWQLMPGSGMRSWEARQVALAQSPRTPRAAWLMTGAEPGPLATARSLQSQEAGAQPAATLLGATSGMGSGLQSLLLDPEDGCGLALAARTANGRLHNIVGGSVQGEIPCPPSAAGPMVLAGNGKVLLAGTGQGEVLAFSWPPPPLGSEQEAPLAKHALHAGSIVAMTLLEAEGLLLSISDDGIMMMTNLAILRGKTPLPLPPPLEGPPVCLQRISDLQAHEDQTRELRVAVKAAHREGEYQASMAMRSLQERMTLAMQRSDAANAKLAERTAEMEQDRDERNADYLAKAVELEDSHAKAAERLQAACERRVEVAQQQVQALEASKLDLRYANEEVVLRVDAGHTKLLQEVQAQFRQRLDKAAERYADLEAAKSAMEKEYRQMLSMYDDEFEDGTEALKELAKQEREAAADRENRLQGKNNLLRSGQYRLQGEKRTDAKNIASMHAQATLLTAQLKESDATISSLRDEASEREDVIGQNYGTIQLLRQQVGELEKSKFVMGFHAKELEAELEPQEKRIVRLTAVIQEQQQCMDNERDCNEALSRSIAARESQVHLLQRNNTALQTAHSKAQSTMVDLCWELQKLLDQASKRTAMQQHVALERLFQRFSASKDPPSISAYADEVARQRDKAEDKLQLLHGRLDDAKRVGRKALAERTAENRILLTELADQKRAARVLKEQLAMPPEFIAAMQESGQSANTPSSGSKKQVAGLRQPSSGSPKSTLRPMTAASQVTTSCTAPHEVSGRPTTAASPAGKMQPGFAEPTARPMTAASGAASDDVSFRPPTAAQLTPRRRPHAPTTPPVVMPSLAESSRASIRESSTRADVLQMCDDEVPTLLFEIAPQDEPENQLSREDLMLAMSEGDETTTPAAAAAHVQPSASSKRTNTARARRPSTAAIHAGPGNLRGSRSRPSTAGGLGLYSNRKRYEAHFGHL